MTFSFHLVMFCIQYQGMMLDCASTKFIHHTLYDTKYKYISLDCLERMHSDVIQRSFKHFCNVLFQGWARLCVASHWKKHCSPWQGWEGCLEDFYWHVRGLAGHGCLDCLDKVSKSYSKGRKWSGLGLLGLLGVHCSSMCSCRTVKFENSPKLCVAGLGRQSSWSDFGESLGEGWGWGSCGEGAGRTPKPSRVA